MKTADFYSSATGTLRVNGGRDENAPAGVSLSIDDLSYIKQGSRANEGNTGTSNYNDLSNKPSINSVELEGNKSLNDLGIQPKIDSSHKVSADNIDDTDTTNKFATAAQLEQITTNQNNILKITPVTLSKRHKPQSADYEIISDLTISIPAGKKYLIHATAMFNNVAPKGVIINKTNAIATNKNTVFSEIDGGETDYGGLTASAIMSNTGSSAFDICIFAKYKSANASGSDVIVSYQDITENS